MDENASSPVSAPPAVVTVPDQTGEKQGGSKMWIAIVAAVVVLGLFITGLVLLITADVDTTSHWRDIFIIIMALESLIIGAALVILIIQLATLINLLQHEIKPIIRSTNETVSTLRGTATFISENISAPIVELNVYLAAIKKFFELIRPGGSRR